MLYGLEERKRFVRPSRDTSKKRHVPARFLSLLGQLAILSEAALYQLFLSRFAMARKAFTVEEANTLLVQIESILVRIEDKKAQAKVHEEKTQILDVLWGDKLAAPNNPDYQEFLRHQQAIFTIFQAINTIVKKEMLDLGLRFPPGGLEHGLIDFPTIFEGRWVYLCWQRGEDQLRFWHEIDAGYMGRQEIAAEHIIKMGKEDDPDALDSSELDL